MSGRPKEFAKGLHFFVDDERRREFKQIAAGLDLTLVGLFRQMMDAWKKANGLAAAPPPARRKKRPARPAPGPTVESNHMER